MKASPLLAVSLTSFLILAPVAAQQQEQDADGRQGEPVVVQATNILPLEPRTIIYEVTYGDRKGDQIRGDMREDPNGGWIFTLDGIRRTFLGHNDGGIQLQAQALIGEKYYIQYSPPTLLLPNRLEAGKTYTDEGQVTIYNLSTDGHLAIESEKTSGSYTQEVRLIDPVRTGVPAGTYEGYHVRVNQQIDSTWATIHLELDMVMVPGVGRIYQETTTRIEKLVFFEDTTRQIIEMVEPPRDARRAAASE